MGTSWALLGLRVLGFGVVVLFQEGFRVLKFSGFRVSGFVTV